MVMNPMGSNPFSIFSANLSDFGGPGRLKQVFFLWGGWPKPGRTVRIVEGKNAFYSV